MVLTLREGLKSDENPPQAAKPRETPLRCAQGKWIAQLGSEKPAADKQSNAQLVADALSDVTKRAEEHNVTQLHVYYTWIDDDQCETVPSDYHLFWSGPYPTERAAKQICNRLGWTTFDDKAHCYGRTIDKDRRGKKRIAPDGTYW